MGGVEIKLGIQDIDSRYIERPHLQLTTTPPQVKSFAVSTQTAENNGYRAPERSGNI
jgi:hypothetical protein